MHNHTRVLVALISISVLAYAIYDTPIVNIQPAIGHTKPKETVPIPIVNDVETESKNISRTTLYVGGEAIFVDFKELDVKFFVLDPKINAATLYEKLSVKALDGDPVAARLLAQELAKCNSLKLAEDHQRITSIKTMYEEKQYMKRQGEGYSYNLVDGEIRNLSLNPASLERMENRYAKQKKHCEGLTVSQQNESRMWAERAAEKGDFLAMNFLMSDAYADAQDKYAWAKKLWSEKGSIEALQTMWDIHYYGADSEDGGFQPSKMKAYAYYLAAGELEYAAGNESNQFNLPNIRTEFDTSKAIISAELSADEHLEAERYAAELISSNPNCCYIPN